VFLNATMLAGIGGAVIPLVLHLLAKARYRNVEWGAMMFLQGLEARQAQSMRLKQWTLLGMRMLLVGLLAVALAQPVVRGRWGAIGSQDRITAVIILDCSYSMGYEEAGRSRFDKARDAARQILWGLGKGNGSEVSLVLLNDQVEVPYAQPTTNLQTVARDLDALTVSTGMADLPAGLAAARQILDHPSRTNRELYIVTDRQAENWRRVEADAAYVKWLQDPKAPTRFYVVPVGGDEAENVAIESVELADGVAVRGQQAEVEVRLRNYSGQARTAMEMVLTATGERATTVAVSVPARSTTTVRVPRTFRLSGSHVVSAEIRSAGLQVDNRFDTAVDVIDPVQVLIVSGDEGGPALSRESFFLKLAMAPYQTTPQRRGNDPAVVTVVKVEEWERVEWAKYPVIVLANVPQVSADQARTLEQRVYEGAGLIVCPGNLSRVENYNSVLYRGGLGLLPARLEPAAPPDGSRATTLLGLELKHPIFRFRRGADPIPAAVFGRYFPASMRTTDARVLGTYSSGEPFLIEGPRGRGRVLMLTTSLDADWTTLPLYQFYLPFVQSMVRYAAAPSVAPRNLPMGSALTAVFEDVVEGAIMVRGDERTTVPVSGRSNQVVYTETAKPGVYRLTAKVKGKDRVVHFVVQYPREESDLGSMTEEAWEARRKALRFARLDPAKEAILPVLAADRGGRDLWLVLLMAAVMLGAGEVWLARAWSERTA
jgi:hypothetical protein